jgi:hypothetical protein
MTGINYYYYDNNHVPKFINRCPRNCGKWIFWDDFLKGYFEVHLTRRHTCHRSKYRTKSFVESMIMHQDQQSDSLLDVAKDGEDIEVILTKLEEKAAYCLWLVQNIKFVLKESKRKRQGAVGK